MIGAVVTWTVHPSRRYGSHPGPWAFAHRGGSALAPENTMLAFERAVGLGLNYLETDVRVTADGVPIAFHDRTLDRVTGLRGRVATQSWDALSRTLILGSEPVCVWTTSWPRSRTPASRSTSRRRARCAR